MRWLFFASLAGVALLSAIIGFSRRRGHRRDTGSIGAAG
jgi:hypothetical protein